MVVCVPVEMASLYAGYCLAKLGRYAEAIADYDSALELEPRNANAYHNRRAAHTHESPSTHMVILSGLEPRAAGICVECADGAGSA